MRRALDFMAKRWHRLAPSFHGPLLDGAVGIFTVCFLLALKRAGAITFLSDDAEIQYLPATRDIARALSEGSFPLLARGAWHGGSFDGEYQYGIFNILEVALSALLWVFRPSFTTAAAIFVLVHLAIMSAGMSRLCQSRGLAPPFAAAAAVSFACNGWLLCWAAASWYPALVSSSFLPWLVWSLEQSSRRPRFSFAAGSVALYLIATAGWPFTILMAGILIVVTLSKVCVRAESFRPAIPIVGASVCGFALAAPALLAIDDYSRGTLRALIMQSLSFDFMVPGSALPGLVVPSVSAIWEWNEPVVRLSRELSGGTVAIAGVVAGAIAVPRFLRRNGWDLAIVVMGLLLVTAPGFGNFRWPFRWLPLVFFGLAPLGAAGLSAALGEARDGSTRRGVSTLLAPGAVGAAMVVIVTVYDLLTSHDGGEATRALGLQLTALLLVWAVAVTISYRAPWIVWSAPLAVFGSIWLVGAQIKLRAPELRAHEFGHQLAESAPFEPGIRYLIAYGGDDSQLAASKPADRYPISRPGNTALYAGIDVLNGYSPQSPRGFYELLGMSWTGGIDPERFSHIATYDLARDGLLGIAGVDGVAVSTSYLPYAGRLTRDWRTVYSGPEGKVFHRPGPPAPRVRCANRVRAAESLSDAIDLFASDTAQIVRITAPVRDAEQGFASCSLDGLTETRLSTSVNVAVAAGGRDAFVVFARPWLPGWRATLEGRSLTTVRASVLFTGVHVPAGGHGRLILAYRPRSLWLGVTMALAAVIVLAGVTIGGHFIARL